MLRKDLLVLLVFSVMLSVLILGCDKEENPIVLGSVSEKDASWQIDVINDVPFVTFEDGSIAEGWDAYQSGVESHLNGFQLEDLSLLIRPHPDILTDAKLAGWGFSVLGYYIRFSAESNYLGGCIQHRVPHTGIMLSRLGTNPPIVNIHFAVWSENGRPCAGVYNSGGRAYFCRRLCGPSYSDIRNVMTSAIVAAGVSYFIAEILASVITPIIWVLVI